MTLTRKPMRRCSPKRADREQRLREVYAEIDEEREPVCAGCGRHAGGLIKLSHSHLVPRGYNEDLITEKANIALHCLDWMDHVGCHTLWESNARRHEMMDFERNLAYVEQADPGYYAQLLLKTHFLNDHATL